MTTEPQASHERPGLSKGARQALLAGLIGLFVMAALALVAIVIASGTPASAGTKLDPPRGILDFQLTNHLGQQIQLSSLPKKVLVLTFLYTHCPDVCPVTTAKFQQTQTLIGDKANQVAFLVVTVDPSKDTVQRLYQFSNQWGMVEKWHFLTGSRDELAPIWDYYWAGPIPRESPNVQADERTQALTPSSSDLQESYESYQVSHGAPIHIITEGAIHVVFGDNFLPSELAHDLQILLR